MHAWTMGEIAAALAVFGAFAALGFRIYTIGGWQREVEMHLSEADRQRKRLSDLMAKVEISRCLQQQLAESISKIQQVSGENRERLVGVEAGLKAIGSKIDDHFERQNGAIERVGVKLESIQQNCIKHYRAIADQTKTDH